MPHLFRGIEGPAPQKPQVSNAGARPRPCHLYRTARLNEDQVPTGLTNFAGNAERPGSGPVRGHSYRNAVFQILLNTPIFVNFLRAHYRRNRLYNKDICQIKNCLACGMLYVVKWYWSPGDKNVAQLKIATIHLWNLCLDTFWGHQSASGQDLGPIDHDEEYHPESFLLYLLTTMQHQLEANPGEYQTFLSLFTIHTVRRWRCDRCKWDSDPDQWEQSLYLPIDVQDLTSRSTSTSIASGINRGLERRAQALNVGAAKQNCGICGNLAKPQVDIVNFPEVLILIRNSEQAQKTRPDIPYDNDMLYMKYWTSARDKKDATCVIIAGETNSDQRNVAFKSYNRDYKLIAGTGELVIDMNRSKSVAFARRALEDVNEWFLMDDEALHEVPGLEQLDRLQRRWDGRGSKPVRNIHPEIFIFRRTDDAGWDHNYHTSTIGPIGPLSANELDDEARYRDYRGRAATEIFTQKIGKGLLKFKISMAPADPGPTDTIPFNLNLSYQYGSNHWNLGDLPTEGSLFPILGNPIEDSRPTPFNYSVVTRYMNRTDEPSKQSASSDAMNIDPSQPATVPFGKNHFANHSDLPRSPNDMDVDEQTHSTFAQRPEIRAAVEAIRKRSQNTYLDEYLRENGFNFAGNNGNNHNHKNNGKGKVKKGKNRGKTNHRGNNNYHQSRGGRGRGKYDNNGGARGGLGNSRGSGRGHGRGRGQGRGN